MAPFKPWLTVHVIEVLPADFSDPRTAQFLEAHLSELAPTAPPESRHALDLTQLDNPSVQMWVAWDEEVIVGTVALADLEPRHLELKSMRTDPSRRGKGIATLLLKHAIQEARKQGTERISLETGSMDFFKPARNLYRKHGFAGCPPFGNYSEDPHSVFLTLELDPK